MIRVNELFKNFYSNEKTIQVLKGIDLEIKPGEIVAICGPSGVGKSTLLHLLGLMEEPTSGSIEMFDNKTHLLISNLRAEWRNKYIGFLFQFHYLLPDFNVYENLFMPTWIKNGAAKMSEDKETIKNLIEHLGLSSLTERYPNELSGGEQQRVALARTLVNQPKLILADEPTGNLDQENREIVFSLLLNEARERKTILVIATHNMELAKKADRIIQLHDGKIIKEERN